MTMDQSTPQYLAPEEFIHYRVCRHSSLTLWIWLALTGPVGPTYAAENSRPENLDEIVVIGVTPVPGAEVVLSKIPSNVQRATAEDIERTNSLSFTEFMQRHFGSVSVNEAQGNPFQADVRFRGYVASPLLGLPQGLSVYQDGARVNEPFGDTVNWALIPESAIASIDLIPGSNPAYGLNTLGATLSIQTKNGISHPGTRAEITAGSWNRIVAQGETGGSLREGLGYFLSAWYFEESGWRDFSPSDAIQTFANLSWLGRMTEHDLSLTYVQTDLVGNGAAPIQLLEKRRKAIFTHPDQTENDLFSLNLNSRYRFGDRAAINSVVYMRNSNIETLNGDDSSFAECNDSPGFVCEEDGDQAVPMRDQNMIPISFGGTVDGASVNRSATNQDGFGVSLQLTVSHGQQDNNNQLIVGATLDSASVSFYSSSELGTLDETRQAISSGFLVQSSFTNLKTKAENIGLFFNDTYSPSRNLALTLAGRYNNTKIKLRDQLGIALNGNHSYSRFNPSAGLTYRFSEQLQVYGGYSESNRTPSPVELTCADPDDPCRLPNAFLSDPPLDDVVAKSREAGFRGTAAGIDWHLGYFSTINEDDILFVNAGNLTNEGFFDNIGKTRREGVELNLKGADRNKHLSWFLNYTYLKAIFDENFIVPSPNNPAAINGEIAVRSGDRIPGVPENILKAGASYQIGAALSVAFDLSYSSNLIFRGDKGDEGEAVSGYMLVNFRAEYQFNEHAAVLIKIDNILDEDYETFGVFGEAKEILGDEFDDSRFLSPGAERAAWLGIRLTL